MTLSEIIREVGELGARSIRVQSDLKAWVNRAQRSIAQRRNWTFLHSQQEATIPSGEFSANLSERFKELAAEKSPVTYTAPTAQFPSPVRVMSRAELETMGPGFNSVVTNANGYWSPFYVFLEQNDGGLWTINLPVGYTHTENATYAISCYLYPPDLAAGSDHNALTDDGELSEALVDLTKAMALLKEDSTDLRGRAARDDAELHIQRAIGQDARRRTAGRRLHM